MVTQTVYARKIGNGAVAVDLPVRTVDLTAAHILASANDQTIGSHRKNSGAHTAGYLSSPLTKRIWPETHLLAHAYNALTCTYVMSSLVGWMSIGEGGGVNLPVSVTSHLLRGGHLSPRVKPWPENRKYSCVEFTARRPLDRRKCRLATLQQEYLSNLAVSQKYIRPGV